MCHVGVSFQKFFISIKSVRQLTDFIETKMSHFKRNGPYREGRPIKYYFSGTLRDPSRILALASSTAFLASAERLSVVKSTPPSFKL